MELTSQPALPVRQVRTRIPLPLHDRLRHLALDLGLSLEELVLQGALLACHHFQVGEGLPEPLAPKGEVAR
jgi:hypothetical protein